MRPLFGACVVSDAMIVSHKLCVLVCSLENFVGKFREWSFIMNGMVLVPFYKIDSIKDCLYGTT